MSDEIKFHPRNVTAWQTELVSGNTATSRLESGVGNCFPGLECDIRNLERRFFPHLAVDFIGGNMLVAGVNLLAAQTAGLSQQMVDTYQMIAEDTASPNPDEFWIVNQISGNFGPFGQLDLSSDDFGTRNDIPADAWTAVRLLPEDSDVTITLTRLPAGAVPVTRTLSGKRISYLDQEGAINEVFSPGELSQSLCSPWTHDFRDCGCFYWASNHPDIAMPQKPADMGPDLALDRPVAWQRSDKGTIASPPPAASMTRADEMRHYEINHRWQELGVVLDGREQGATYTPLMFTADPFLTIADLVAHVRYAAGVELAVTLEYLSAAYSLDRAAAGGTLADDVNASFAEIMRIAIGEMRHIRAANDMLRAFFERGLIPEFTPALQVASELPTGGNTTRPLQFRSLTMATLDSFIDIERPSFSVDGLYGRILETVKQLAPGPLEAVVESIMADGTDHFDTFSFIKEWLGRHPESAYLLQLDEPDNSINSHVQLQNTYKDLLELLHQAYLIGLPSGADLIAQSRADMLARPDGLRGLCEALAADNIRVTFIAPADTRFTPINRPT